MPIATVGPSPSSMLTQPVKPALREHREDPVVVVEALPDHAVLKWRVAGLRIAVDLQVLPSSR